MGRASKLKNYLNLKDKNSVEVCSWAVDTDTSGVAHCKYCDTDVSYKSRKKGLLHHSKSQNHINNTPKNNAI